MPILTPADLAPFAVIEEAKAQAMIDDLTAQAYLIAPCLKDDADPVPDPGLLAAAKAVLRQAALRWNEAGSGNKKGWTRGPFGEVIDTTVPRKSLFWPTEILDLERLCSTGAGKAFMIDMTTETGGNPYIDSGQGEIYDADRPDLDFQWSWPGSR